MNPDHRLFARDRSCLVVIDVQRYFLDKLPAAERAPLVARIGWLVDIAAILGIPVLATAEDIASCGPLAPEIEERLPPGTPVHDKLVFGLAGQPSILTALRSLARDECLLCGLETDVCVAQSAIGLMTGGFRVGVIEDATASPPPGHAAGMRRIAAAGAVVTACKGIYYEWVRGVAADADTKSRIKAGLPHGLSL